MENQQANHKKGYHGFHKAGKITLCLGIPFSCVGLGCTIWLAISLAVNAAKLEEGGGDLEGVLVSLSTVGLTFSIILLVLGISALIASIVFYSISNGMRRKDEARGISYNE